MGVETNILEKFVNGAIKGKRVIGRPLKPNLRKKWGYGDIELMFNPRNSVEAAIGQVLKFTAPYLNYVTYTFHVEKCQEYGMRVDDFYHNQFFKEEAPIMHLYAQNFHPTTLLERCRLVAGSRRQRTMFKGVQVPDWAKAKNYEDGWEFDLYSRVAWDEAMHEFHSEWTPMQFNGKGNRPHGPLNWLRYDHHFSGHSSKLFYNEVPNPSWRHHGGHVEDQDFYSFTYADQKQKLKFGIDTTTEEGRQKYKEMWQFFEGMTPEMFRGHDMVYPHEQIPTPPNELHYLRAWKQYRQFALEEQLKNAIAAEAIDADVVADHHSFIAEHGKDLSEVAVKLGSGQLDHAKDDPRFASAQKVWQFLGLDSFKPSRKTSKPYDEQFWSLYDQALVLTPADMESKIELITADDAKRAQLEAKAAQQQIDGESQKKLE